MHSARCDIVRRSLLLSSSLWRSASARPPQSSALFAACSSSRFRTVIAVVQPARFFPGRVNALLNMANSGHHLSAMMVQGRSHRMTEIVARLAPGVSVEQARTEVAAVSSRVHKEFGEAYDPASHDRIAVIPFHDVLGERAKMTLWLLMGAAAFVMIISAANV